MKIELRIPGARFILPGFHSQHRTGGPSAARRRQPAGILIGTLLVAALTAGTITAQPARKAAQPARKAVQPKVHVLDLNSPITDLRSLDLDALDADPRLRRAGMRSLSALRDWHVLRASAGSVSTSGSNVAAKSGDVGFAAMQEFAGPVAGTPYDFPALVTLADGDILMAFRDPGVFPEFWDGPPTDPAKVLLARSEDGGASWGEAVQIGEGDFPLDFFNLELTRLGSGRLLLNDLTPLEEDHYWISDDDGATWTATPITERLSPGWHGPIDGKVWYTYLSDANRDLFYRASADGVTWEPARMLLDNPNPDRYEMYVQAVGSAGGNNVVAAVVQMDWETWTQSVLVLRSTDGGTTWSSPATLGTPGFEMYPSAIDRDPDGTLWMAATGLRLWDGPSDNPFENTADVHYFTSGDDGLTWAGPIAFTSYLGDDHSPDIAMSPDGPLVVFQSVRLSPQGIALGVLGLTPDSDAPPVVTTSVMPWGGLAAGASTEIVTAAGSASGVASAGLIVTVDGAESEIPMAQGSDLCSAYNLGYDFCWVGTIGPFALGSEVTVRSVATDNNGRSATSWTEAIAIIAVHDVGSVTLPVQPNGFISNVTWGPTGDDYMCCGGMWAGTSAGGGTVVGEYSWIPTDGVTPTMGPGESDLDIAVSYHDGGILGVGVMQRSYQWADGQRSNGIVIEYEYTNDGSVGDIDALYAAMSLDADLANGTQFWDDLISYSAAANLIYMYDSGDQCATAGPCPEGYIGIAVIGDESGSPGATLAPHTATMNDGSDSQWVLMRAGINPALTSPTPVDPGDHRMLLTAQPFALASGASQKVAFALVMGTGPEDLAASAQALALAYDTHVTGVEHVVGVEIPGEFHLEQNYPNPFNPATTLRFALPQASKATLTVHNVLGQEIATLVAGDLAAGVHDVRWDATGLPSGLYLYRLEAGDYTATRRMVLVK